MLYQLLYFHQPEADDIPDKRNLSDGRLQYLFITRKRKSSEANDDLKSILYRAPKIKAEIKIKMLLIYKIKITDYNYNNSMWIIVSLNTEGPAAAS